MFGSKWFHLDTPRHLTHFTPKGLVHLLEEIGFEVIEQRQLYAPEYTLGRVGSKYYVSGFTTT